MSPDAVPSAVELPKLASRGGLQHVAYGLYRVPDIPPTQYDQFAEALLRAGGGAFLYGESVLALFRLADVNPRRIAARADPGAVLAHRRAGQDGAVIVEPFSGPRRAPR